MGHASLVAGLAPSGHITQQLLEARKQLSSKMFHWSSTDDMIFHFWLPCRMSDAKLELYPIQSLDAPSLPKRMHKGNCNSVAQEMRPQDPSIAAGEDKHAEQELTPTWVRFGSLQVAHSI